MARLSRTRRATVVALVAIAALALSAPAGARGPMAGRPLGAGLVVAPGAAPLPAGLSAASFVVADLDTGQVLAARDAHRPLPPASTLKVLTALTLIPRIDRTAPITPTLADVSVEGSRVGLVESLRYPAYQVFRGMLMTSGNDAANALATAAGGAAVTARSMNEEAARVGATDTRAVNASGLDAPGQVSTAYDLAAIGRAAMQLPDFRSYVGTKRSTILGRLGRPLRITSHDKLLFNYPGAIGIKNGYTVRAGATYIGAARRDGRAVLVTVMRAKPRVWPEVASLLDWGFAAQAAGAEPVGALPVLPGGETLAGTRAGGVPAAARVTGPPARPRLPLAVVLMTALATAVTVRRRSRAER